MDDWRSSPLNNTMLIIGIIVIAIIIILIIMVVFSSYPPPPPSSAGGSGGSSVESNGIGKNDVPKTPINKNPQQPQQPQQPRYPRRDNANVPSKSGSQISFVSDNSRHSKSEEYLGNSTVLSPTDDDHNIKSVNTKSDISPKKGKRGHLSSYEVSSRSQRSKYDIEETSGSTITDESKDYVNYGVFSSDFSSK